jgi:hypothetical protein
VVTDNGLRSDDGTRILEDKVSDDDGSADDEAAEVRPGIASDESGGR